MSSAFVYYRIWYAFRSDFDFARFDGMSDEDLNAALEKLAREQMAARKEGKGTEESAPDRKPLVRRIAPAMDDPLDEAGAVLGWFNERWIRFPGRRFMENSPVVWERVATLPGPRPSSRVYFGEVDMEGSVDFVRVLQERCWGERFHWIQPRFGCVSVETLSTAEQALVRLGIQDLEADTSAYRAWRASGRRRGSPAYKSRLFQPEHCQIVDEAYRTADLLGMTGQKEKTGATPSRKKRGRPPRPDDVVKRVTEAWQTGRYSSKEELAAELGMEVGEVRKIIDADRKAPRK